MAEACTAARRTTLGALAQQHMTHGRVNAETGGLARRHRAAIVRLNRRNLACAAPQLAQDKDLTCLDKEMGWQERKSGKGVRRRRQVGCAGKEFSV
eukprot:352550-Chlamydomonas_euryale.AAC.16